MTQTGLSPRAFTRLVYALLALFLVSLFLRGASETTLSVVFGTTALFAVCLSSAMHVLGTRSTLILLGISLPFGWFAEQMGATRGWFFGAYTYTDVMGPKLGAVPVVVPLGWFSVVYIAYVIGNLIVHRAPVDRSHGLLNRFWMSLLAGFIVTAYDLGADPYMINVTKSWIMEKKDGWYFGETVQGFVGWVLVTFVVTFAFRAVSGRAEDIAQSPTRRRDALVPLIAYAGLMVFFVLRGDPVETRTIVVFAMGIPVLCAIAGFAQWHPLHAQTASGRDGDSRLPAHTRWPDELLDASRLEGDPIADATVSEIVSDHGLAQAGRLLAELGRNDEIPDFGNSPAADALTRYLDETSSLPPWADREQIALAERLFFDHGVMMVFGLFCGSLPESYANGNVAKVLQMAGQLEDHAEHRIRATAAMIFPVMDEGGLGAEGRGIHQIQKVRLIHAIIRHLILERDPANELPSEYREHFAASSWSEDDGAPINQEQLAFVLLTFSYVFLECWNKLGVRLTRAEKDAYIHCWTVAAHLLGVRREMMAHSFDEARQLFEILKARGGGATPEGRALSRALAAVQEVHVPWRILKPVGPLLSRFLLGRETADLLGIAEQVPWISRALFSVVIALLRASEVALRVLGWSPLTFAAEKLARHYLRALLMHQTRPLTLPTRLLHAWNLPANERSS